MISFPGCKINLGLQVLSKRSDDYHDIASVMYPVGINDILEIIPLEKSEKTVFTSSGLTIPGSSSDNLCVKAYDLIKTTYDLPPVHIHLHKCIPMGGGLGGGSSNGAETIHLLNDLFELGMSNGNKRKFAEKLGSDCPFFIEKKPQLAEGTGTTLTPIDLNLSGYFLVLLNNGIHVSTKEAYSGVHLNKKQPDLKTIVQRDISEWKDLLVNGFEQHIFELYPSLPKIKKEFYDNGAVYASMTGSGSTMYGLFKDAPNFEPPANGFLKILKL